MALSDIKPYSQWTLPESLAALGYTAGIDDNGNTLYRNDEGSRLRFDENGDPIIGGANLRQGYNSALQQAGYGLYDPYSLGMKAKKLGMSEQDALQHIYGPGSQIINDPTHGALIQATRPADQWQEPDLTDHSFLANYGGALLMLPAVGNIAAAAGAAGAAGGAGGAANTGLFASGSYAPVSDAVASGSLGAGGSSAYSLAAPGAGIGGVGTAGTGLSSGSTIGLGATSASGAPITNALLSPSITGGATGLAKAGASMGFLDNLFSASNLMNFAGNIGGALINSNATSKAVGAQTDATNSSNALLASIYGQNREDLAPWRNAGVNALTQLAKLNTPGQQLDQAQLDPGYAFRQQQGEQAINRSAAARGLLGSGRTIKDLIRFNQDYATNEFGNVNNRLLALSGLGQTATNTGVQAGQNYGTQVGQNMLGAGNARASGYVGQANALSGAIGSTLNYSNQNALLDRLIGAGAFGRAQ